MAHEQRNSSDSDDGAWEAPPVLAPAPKVQDVQDVVISIPNEDEKNKEHSLDSQYMIRKASNVALPSGSSKEETDSKHGHGRHHHHHHHLNSTESDSRQDSSLQHGDGDSNHPHRHHHHHHHHHRHHHHHYPQGGLHYRHKGGDFSGSQIRVSVSQQPSGGGEPAYEDMENVEYVDEDEEEEGATLLQYDPPYLAQTTGGTGALPSHVIFGESKTFQTVKSMKEFTSIRKHHRLKCMERKLTEAEKEELLDLIKPPVVLGKQHGNIWMERISREPAGCEGSTALEEELNYLLERRRARHFGICMIRRELYGECFDELLRQMALDVPGRAILLLRCRQDIQHTLMVHERLFASAESHCAQYDALANDGMDDIILKLDHHRAKVEELFKLKEHLHLQLNSNSVKYEKEIENLLKEQKDHLAYLKNQNSLLHNQLRKFTGGGGASIKASSKKSEGDAASTGTGATLAGAPSGDARFIKSGTGATGEKGWAILRKKVLKKGRSRPRTIQSMKDV